MRPTYFFLYSSKKRIKTQFTGWHWCKHEHEGFSLVHVLLQNVYHFSHAATAAFSTMYGRVRNPCIHGLQVRRNEGTERSRKKSKTSENKARECCATHRRKCRFRNWVKGKKRHAHTKNIQERYSISRLVVCSDWIWEHSGVAQTCILQKRDSLFTRAPRHMHTHIFCIHSNHTHKNNNLLVFSRFGWVDTICHCRRHRHRRRIGFGQEATTARETCGAGEATAKVFHVVHFIFYFDSNFVYSLLSLFFISSLHFSSIVCIHINLMTFLCFLFFSLRVVYFSLLFLYTEHLRFYVNSEHNQIYIYVRYTLDAFS